MLLRFITTVIAALLCGQLFGQANYINAMFDHDGRADWMNSIIQNGNGYMAVGWTANPGNVDKGIMFIDSSGNLTDWIVVYNQNFTENTQQMVRVDSNRIAKAIWFMDNSSGDRQFKLEVINNQGNTLWERVYGDSTINEGAQAITYSNGRIVITGNRMVNGDQDIYIVAWDTAGNFLWDRAIGSPTNNENSYTIVPMDDGGYLVGGYKTFVNQRKDWLYAKVDSLGDVKWQKTIGNIGSDGLISIIPVKGNKYMLIGYRQVKFHPNIPEYHGQLVVVDGNGNSVWSKFYVGDQRKLLLYGGIELDDGSIIVYGVLEDDITTRDYGYLLKVDSVGNQVWSRRIVYSATVHQYLRDIVQTPDGGFLMVGSVLVSPNDAWVVKVDSMGCLEPGCHLGTGTTGPQYTGPAVQLYPNPVQHTLTIALPEGIHQASAIITNISGQVVYSSTHISGTQTLSTSGWPAGIYLVQVATEAGLWQGKVVKVD